MKFNRLRLSGFKSFVDPTDLIIEPGLTGVVGPNGCGKSNLLEAMRWVMGENSFKNMRGSGMEDVIFAGTTGRPARNHAEVVLYIDNSDRSAPAAYNEFDMIEVSRKIELDQGSTYRINGREVRARDVQLLFADASTGAHSPALVRQGQIAQLISSKPINRRRILEEAAGITGLYTRRHEAELRLKAAETNLTRLDDVVAQVESQLASLKRQARQAVRYRNLSGQIRETEAILLHLRWEQAVATLKQSEEKLAETDQRVTELTREAAAATTIEAEAADRLPPLREKEAEAAARLHRLTVERENLDAEELRAKEQATRLTARLDQIGQDLARERHLIEDTQGAMARLDTEAGELRAAEDSQVQAQEKAQARVEETRVTLEATESELDRINQEIAALNAERTSLVRSVEQGRQRIEKLERQLAEIARERETLSDAEEKKAQIALQSVELDEAAARVAEAERLALEAEEARRKAQDDEKASREPMQAAERKAGDLAAEAKTLADLLAVGESDLWPPVIDAITVEHGYETALGAALGDDLAVPEDQAAPIHWGTLAPFETAPALPEGATPLSYFVKAPASLARRLSQIGIVVSVEEGRRLQAQLTPGQRLVTQTGALWRWDGYTAAADAPTASARRLEQRNRLADLEKELASARAVAAEARGAFDAAHVAAEEAMQQEQARRAALREAQGAQNRIRDALAAAERAASAQLSRLAALAESDERLSGDKVEAARALEEAEVALQNLKPDEEPRAKAAELRERVAAFRLELSEARAEHEGLRREAEQRARRLSAIAQERDAWQLRATNAERQIGTLEERKTEAETELKALEGVPAEIEEKRRALLTLISEAETARGQAADDLAAAERTLAEAVKHAKDVQHQLGETREERARIDGLVTGGRERRAEAEDRIREVLECEPEAALAQANLEEGAELPGLEQIDTKLERLKRERESLGGVNLRAEEESRELTEQLETMTSEREDLVSAIAKLRQGIGSLNREGRERMLEAFEKVNANFSRLFTHLFGGGEAHLKLTESDDPLEAGLEIMARPPGKRLQVMSLLSGGEQALTAMSLIFAVFLTNPSPICVLDEVDAPLDDANVERFCDLMDEMTRTTETRFLIITHHALTMARMNRLYGVTMQERGVSTLVSVDLDRAEAMREAS
ncbi:MAG: chromosome segregation protein SMC [Alphaproteobacteria bacterium]|nr:chromosome segregation protein SMC [Alphaproteobacteria bacterium]MDX5414798.1 chromosome segregation protein SMC [Alphaproteobacteria bacterium]MDX5491979.1 chromosome segregation protein SMC [Alphaproteobacteria bacterium]